MIATLGDINMHYKIDGTGKTIFLLHGLALDHTIWDELVALYSDQARFIRPDLRGHGLTNLGSADGSLEQFASDIVKLADHLEIEKFILAGHSMGGYTSLAFAEKYAERLNGLIMVTSNAQEDDSERKQNRRVDAEQVLKLGSVYAAEKMAPKLTWDQSVQKTCFELISGTTAEGIANVQKAIASRRNRLDVIADLEVPFLAIAGEEDQLRPPTVAYEMVEKAKIGKIVVLPGVGHMPMMEAPLTLGALLLTV